MKRTALARSGPPSLGAPKVALQMDEKFYLKDPTSSELGESIIEHGILLLDEIGYEEFTFRKLAMRIGTTEASIYRYFASKHRLLLYLIAWYWNWMEHRLLQVTSNVASPEERLRRALRQLTEQIHNDAATPRVDEAALYRIVVAESPKAYLHREVDSENRDGLFRSYKRLCRAVGQIVAEINPHYKYPTALISSVVESSHTQKYFAEHLPSLTEVEHTDAERSTTAFLTELVFKAIAR